MHLIINDRTVKINILIDFSFNAIVKFIIHAIRIFLK